MSQTPEWLSKLLAETEPRRVRQAVLASSNKEPGQIWRALAMDRGEASALVLVLHLDPEAHHAAVVLLTPDIEFSGNRDYLLLGDETGTGYDLAAQTELASSVWEVQLDSHLGNVPADQLEAIQVMAGDGDAAPHRDRLAGPPILDPSDPRWNIKRAELRRLQALSGECVRQLVDGEAMHLLPDPLSLRVTDNPAENVDLEEYVLALLDAMNDGRMDLPVWLIEQIFDDEVALATLRASGLFDVARALLGKAVGRLGDEASQLAYPATTAEVPGSRYDTMRHVLLAQARTAGTTSVAFVVKSDHYSSDERLTKTYVHEHLIMQCVTIQDRTLVGRTS